jgi:hypothetical protein
MTATLMSGTKVPCNKAARPSFLSMEVNKMKKFTVGLTALVLSLALLLGFAAPTMADEGSSLECVPYAGWLAETMDVSCDELMALHAEGVGFGQIMMAWRISQTLPDYEGSWEDLLASHLEGEGWGQTMMAYRFAAAFDADPAEMLALKEAGLGWGQIGHAHALAAADLGLSFDDAVALLQSDLGWGEIRDQLGLPDGPPPWAGKPAWTGEGGQPSWGGGPPPWAGGDDDDGNGPPPWAGGPPPWAGNGRP